MKLNQLKEQTHAGDTITVKELMDILDRIVKNDPSAKSYTITTDRGSKVAPIFRVQAFEKEKVVHFLA